MQTEKPLEELYNVKVERKVSKKRLEELGVSRWSVWKTGKCKLPWDWQVDQLVYIEEGEVRVVPEGSKRSKLKEHMQYCIDHPDEISKLAKVKAQVSKDKGVMMENIEKKAVVRKLSSWWTKPKKPSLTG